ncbi:MAG: hypothetical protein DHS20C11_12180 [Lysobacteraceae bacterium]|nr:MAG: hypothetical protein DHS20C11_12180 [Xanthomonadaceae bacterium]
MNRPLTRTDLLSLERYSEQRETMRRQLVAHKKQRQLALGPNVTLYFEDRRTIAYQIQEMLRIERIFEAAGIEEELETYNPLIPDGDNLKATMMIEYPDPSERRQRLQQLVGIEHQIWVAGSASGRRYAVADEDLERATEDKTSAVHFLRFQLPDSLIAEIKSDTPIQFGCNHPQYDVQVTIDGSLRAQLRNDLA